MMQLSATVYLYCARYYRNMQNFITCPQESSLTGIHVHIHVEQNKFLTYALS